MINYLRTQRFACYLRKTETLLEKGLLGTCSIRGLSRRTRRSSRRIGHRAVPKTSRKSKQNEYWKILNIQSKNYCQIRVQLNLNQLVEFRFVLHCSDMFTSSLSLEMWLMCMIKSRLTNCRRKTNGGFVHSSGLQAESFSDSDWMRLQDSSWSVLSNPSSSSKLSNRSSSSSRFGFSTFLERLSAGAMFDMQTWAYVLQFNNQYSLETSLGVWRQNDIILIT